MNSSPPNSTEADKNALYGRYQRGEDWRQDLDRKLAHKALDIPIADDMQVTHNTTTTGITPRHLLAVGAVLASMIVGGAGAFALLKPSASPAPAAAPAAEPVEFPDEFELQLMPD